MKKNYTLFVVMVFLSYFIFSSFEIKSEDDLKASMARGKQIYETYCVSCHMSAGEGIDGVFPKLAKAPGVMNLKSAVSIILKGKGNMSPQSLNDQQTADVLNYIRNSWGNQGNIVLAADVKANK